MTKRICAIEQCLATTRGRRLFANLRGTLFSLALLITLVMVAPIQLLAQTSSTGALSGTITDPNGALVPNAEVKVINEATGETRVATSGSDGSYFVPQLSPGSYSVQAAAANFKRVVSSGVRVEVTETTTLEIKLELGTTSESVLIRSDDTALVQTESSALGRVTNQKVVVSLPLVTRNYTQIIGLSPGVTTNVTNAAELGRGLGGLAPEFNLVGIGTYVHGARGYDNSFMMNGLSINDLQGSGRASNGVAIPNPDTIQGFKVQTGLYDAAFGRNAGANVNVVTRGGSNEFHGTVFEFFRNDALNANDFFFNRVGRKKGVLRQNQFGFTLGGPIKRDKLLFFTSYQGTRQANGIAGFSRAEAFAPPLTNDRSATAIGSLFAGQRGVFGGTAILADGSNINPVALRLLQMKLANGDFLIPTPQVVDRTQPFSRQGFSVFSEASIFNENQYMINIDFLHSENSRFEGRFFSASGDRGVPRLFTNIPGFPSLAKEKFRNLSLSHNYILSPSLVNQAQFGFHYTYYRGGPPDQPGSTLRFSDVGINAPAQTDELPIIFISGSYQIGGQSTVFFTQNHYNLQDSLSYVRGRHTLNFGAGINFSEVNVPPDERGLGGFLLFLSFPDFLLGLSAVQNGTSFSNVFLASNTLGIVDRSERVRNGFTYVQDDLKVTPRLTLNLGLRYERIGGFSEDLGRNVNFNFALATPNPPPTGSLAGFVVPSNFSGGTVPSEVTQLDSKLVINGDRQNTFAPRLGFAWQVLPNSSRLVLRGGYGIYYTRLTGQTVFQLVSQPPFAVSRALSGVANRNATFSSPFQPEIPVSAFPLFTPYSPTTAFTQRALAPDYRPSMTQQYSLNIQTQFARDLLLEVGYFGTRGTQLLRTRSLNQAQLASPATPIRGVTANTLGNLAQRVPILGFQAVGIHQIETSGASWYNALEASLTKRFNRGLQFLASYTFSKLLDSDGANVDTTANGTALTIGNQNDPGARYGRAIYDRTHRFVFSYLYEFPIPASRAGFFGKVLGGWAVSGTTTIQSGQALTITATNGNSLFGITGTAGDRAQMASGCTAADLTTPGPVSQRLTNYFSRSCFTLPPIIGDPEVSGPNTGLRVGRGFGNSGVGIVNGPGQNNSDLAVIKRTPVGWPTEVSNVEFRTEFFNVFNHPQFANPNTEFTSTAFGTITSTSVNPRVIQFALKFNF